MLQRASKFVETGPTDPRWTVATPRWANELHDATLSWNPNVYRQEVEWQLDQPVLVKTRPIYALSEEGQIMQRQVRQWLKEGKTSLVEQLLEIELDDPDCPRSIEDSDFWDRFWVMYDEEKTYTTLTPEEWVFGYCEGGK